MSEPNQHDRDAEDALLGCMLTMPHVVGDVATLVVGEDFYRSVSAAAFAAIVAAHNHGDDLGPAGLATVLREAGADPDPKWILRLLETADGAWRRHARSVVAYRVRRELVVVANGVLSDTREPGMDPAEALDRLKAGLARIHIPDGTPPADLHDLDEFIDAPAQQEPPWLVPGLLRRGWRVVVVGAEGQGKSWMFRQFAICAAQGIHPFGLTTGHPPVRVLLVDVENPGDAVAEACTRIRDQARRAVQYEPGRAWLWHRPQGLNLRSRAHRAELAAVLAASRPDVVCAGPVYKLYGRDPRESDEQAVADLQRILDDLRTRFGFALLLEHHAPQDSQGHRIMRPYGSSLWLRWPEIGIGLEKDPDRPQTVTKLARWRGDRMRSVWPERIERGIGWPWKGLWPDDEWRSMR